MSSRRVVISGNTYPVKDQIKALGGRWDGYRKVWTVPAENADEARALVAGAPASRPSFSRARRRYERRDHEDCLSTGPCGPNCEYASLFSR